MEMNPDYCCCCSHSVFWMLFFLRQVFVETLDKCFENVCELDLIFHVDKVGEQCFPSH